jgi:hypothetical protein
VGVPLSKGTPMKKKERWFWVDLTSIRVKAKDENDAMYKVLNLLRTGKETAKVEQAWEEVQ